MDVIQAPTDSVGLSQSYYREGIRSHPSRMVLVQVEPMDGAGMVVIMSPTPSKDMPVGTSLHMGATVLDILDMLLFFA